MPKLIQKKKKKATIVNMDLKNNRGQYAVINIRNRAKINTNNDRYKGTMTDIKGKKCCLYNQNVT